VHLGAPSSPIAYYQQVGRAGRGVERAEVVLLPGVEDKEIWRYFTSLAFPPQATVERVLEALAGAAKPLSTMALEPLVNLKRSRLELLLKVLDADGAVKRVQGGWISTGQPWFYDTERYARITAAREAEQRAMLEYATTRECRMEFLRRQLDDPEAAPCGRCDNCTGERRDATVNASVVDAAGSHAKRAWVTVEARRQWPSGMSAVGVDLKGKIPAGEQAAEGRALARLTDLGWGAALRDLLGPGVPDQPVRPQLLGAMVNVLKEWAAEDAPGGPWSGAGRPVGIVTIASRSRPHLVASLAEGIAEIGRLPIAGGLDRVRDDGHAGPSNSAWRLRSVYEAFGLGPQLRERLAGCPGPVLLVDDLVDSGWTVTVAARLLRQAGAPAVLPLALAVAG
jgi:ATP-dependent DNA helicase RecQ